MPQKCRVCQHPDTREMEKQYVRGKPKTRIAKEHGVHAQSVDYHMDNHLTDKLVRTVQRKEQVHAENMLEGINDLLDQTKSILNEAQSNDQKSLALKAIKEAKSIYELLSKIAVKLEEYRRKDEAKEAGQVNQHVEKGLKTLSDTELECFIQLMGKIHSANPDYELDPDVRDFVEYTFSQRFQSAESESVVTQSVSSKNPGDRLEEDRNSQNTNDDEPEMIPDLDLDLDDLDLSDSNEIPGESNDPDWEYRNKWWE